MLSFRGPDNSERFPNNQRDFSRGRAIFKKKESRQMILISETERSDGFHSLVIPVERLRCCRIGKIHSEASRLAGLHSQEREQDLFFDAILLIRDGKGLFVVS